MKKQFNIKPISAVKNVAKPIAKFEVADLFGFLTEKDKNGSCGCEPQFMGLNKPVFSL